MMEEQEEKRKEVCVVVWEFVAHREQKTVATDVGFAIL